MAEAISVSALNKYVKSILEGDVLLADIAIRGEISNFNRNYKSGHCYFRIKDDKASVNAVMFRSAAAALGFGPENGMQVIIRGRISLYERDGAFQVYAEYMFPDGAGAIQLAFEQMKARLEKEGLFDPEHKQMLPAFPGRVGLVTSKTGAALQDILKVAEYRCPVADFLLAPVTVQGVQAAEEIIRAVQALDARPDVDLIVIARGGGSAEDLWLFNDEGIARAVYACGTPVISAIGHEIDFTILDFVADLRAPTPSAAAEIALPDIRGTVGEMLHIYTKIANHMQFRLHSCYNELDRIIEHPVLLRPGAVYERYTLRLEAARTGICGGVQARLEAAKQRFGAASGLAAGLSPYATLARGYAALHTPDGTAVQSVQDVDVGGGLEAVLADGSLLCEVRGRTEKHTKAKAAGVAEA